MTVDTREDQFEDRLLVDLRRLVAGGEARSTVPSRRSRAGVSMSLVAASAVGVAVVLTFLLGGSSHRSGIAEAEVVTRASTALARPGSIIHLSVISYGDTRCLGDQAPARCLGSAAPLASGADPTPEQASYTFDEWTDASSGAQHTIYGTGDETVVEGRRRRSFDPANNTITTTEQSTARPSQSQAAFPDVAGLGVEELRVLYKEAARGTGTTKLLGSPTLGGRGTYQLEIAEGSSVVVIYIDQQTFLPMRLVWSTERSSGSRSVSVSDFFATLVPITADSTALLGMKPHPGAQQVQLSESALSKVISAARPERVSQSDASEAARQDPLTSG